MINPISWVYQLDAFFEKLFSIIFSYHTDKLMIKVFVYFQTYKAIKIVKNIEICMPLRAAQKGGGGREKILEEGASRIG